jgi:hypothetical protein
MDPTQILTVTQVLTTSQIISGSVSIALSTVQLSVSPIEAMGVTLGYLLALSLFLMVCKFQQWALILALIAVAAWLPFSVTPLSWVEAGMGLFFIMVSSALRSVLNFWK